MLKENKKKIIDLEKENKKKLIDLEKENIDLQDKIKVLEGLEAVRKRPGSGRTERTRPYATSRLNKARAGP